MLGPHCTDNPPNLSSNCGSGNIQEIGGLKTYVTGHEDSKLAILLLADAYGYEAPLLRKIADKIADLGFLVVVPDFYYGDNYGPGKTPEGWVAAHCPDKGCENAKDVIAALRNKGVSKLGAAGFCWGGMVVVRLAKYDCIQAGVVLHPGPITVEEINEVKTPIAILGAEFDDLAPPELLKQFRSILSAKGEVDSFVKIFAGVGHGWAVRYNEDDESAVKSAEESQSDMINWLTKYVN